MIKDAIDYVISLAMLSLLVFGFYAIILFVFATQLNFLLYLSLEFMAVAIIGEVIVTLYKEHEKNMH